MFGDERKLHVLLFTDRPELSAHLLEDAIPCKPEMDSCDVEVVWQSRGAEDDLENRETRVVRVSARERSGRRPDPPVSAGLRRQLLQGFGDIRLEIADPAGGCTIGELEVGPEELKNPNEMGFPRAEESAHPRRGLRRMIEILDILPEDLPETIVIGALTDKMFELVPSDDPLRII
ncbi:hypothetical protein DSECCO2_656610 [anaerobic digester metagenome]